jgi:hypothetical protein
VLGIVSVAFVPTAEAATTYKGSVPTGIVAVQPLVIALTSTFAVANVYTVLLFGPAGADADLLYRYTKALVMEPRNAADPLAPVTSAG